MIQYFSERHNKFDNEIHNEMVKNAKHIEASETMLQVFARTVFMPVNQDTFDITPKQLLKKDLLGYNCVHSAAIAGNKEFLSSIFEYISNIKIEGYDDSQNKEYINKFKKLVTNAKNFNNDRPLHLALTKDVVEILINNGAKVNVKDKSGYTPLHNAQNTEIAVLLTKSGANLQAISVDNTTPVQYHLSNNDEEIANAILTTYKEMIKENPEKYNTPEVAKETSRLHHTGVMTRIMRCLCFVPKDDVQKEFRISNSKER